MYFADENGTHIANIPYGEYLKPLPIPHNAVISKISEINSGEDNAAIINQEIEMLEKDGILAIPEGCFKVSTIRLKSDMTFFLSKGATLLALSCEENEKSSHPLEGSVIIADCANNLRICGGGTLCGQGPSYCTEPKESSPMHPLPFFNLKERVLGSRYRIHFAKKTNRNYLLYLKDCDNLLVEGIKLTEAQTWTFVLESCVNVHIENVVIDNHMHVANSDGIDICGGRHITVAHCFIATGDDAIVLKSVKGPISDVHVMDCMLSSFANCFKIGTETVYDVSDISVSDCRFFMPDGIVGGYSGIALESADGANIARVTVSHIQMEGISSAFLIWLGHRLRFGKKEMGSLKDVSLTDISASDVELPSAITGCRFLGRRYEASGITLENIQCVYRESGEKFNIRRPVPEISMGDYPEITRVSHHYVKSHEKSGYWDLPCFGLFIRHAKGVFVENMTTRPRSCSKLNEFYIRKSEEVNVFGK